MSFCPQCRTPLEPGARFCSNCGYTVPVAPAQPPGPRPFAGTPGFGGPPQGAPPGYGPPPAPGYGPPPAAPGYGAPPAAPGYAAPPAAPAYGAPGYGAPPGPPGYGPAPVPPPAEDEGAGMKVLGGCGIAGCLGAVAAVVVGLGLIVLLVMMAGSSSGGTASGPSSGPGGEVPTEGSVRNLVRQQVGAYQLVGTTPLEKVPPGVVDSIGAVYSSSSGAKVIHVLLVYPTESIASDRIEAVFQSSLSSLKPGQKVSRGNVKDANGNIRGTIVGVTGGYPEAFYWNNRKLVVIVEAPAPHAKLFESNAPY